MADIYDFNEDENVAEISLDIKSSAKKQEIIAISDPNLLHKVLS